MKLKSLALNLNTWGPNDGRYSGQIRYDGENGAVELLLDPIISDRLLACIGPAITESALLTAKKLEESIAQSRLEAKSGPALQA